MVCIRWRSQLHDSPSFKSRLYLKGSLFACQPFACQPFFHDNECCPAGVMQWVSFTVEQFAPSLFLLCHGWLTTTKFSYRFPILDTSAIALCVLLVTHQSQSECWGTWICPGPRPNVWQATKSLQPLRGCKLPTRQPSEKQQLKERQEHAWPNNVNLQDPVSFFLQVAKKEAEARAGKSCGNVTNSNSYETKPQVVLLLSQSSQWLSLPW